MSVSRVTIDLSSGFARLQLVSDLSRVARDEGPGVLSRIVRLVPGAPPAAALERVVAAQGRFDAVLDGAEAAALQSALALAATLPQQDPEAFRAATAILLADRLQGAVGEDSLYWHFDAHRESYRAQPAPARAAIMGAFVLLQRMGRIALDAPPARADVLTRPADEVCAALAALVREMTDEVLRDVARADRGEDADRHAAALRRLRRQDVPLLPRDAARWFPGEVVDLASLFPRGPGFAPATALLLLEALEAPEPAPGLEMRWMQFADAYLALPDAPRAALLAGFRHLHETHLGPGRPGWDPYRGWSAERIAAEGVAIPPADA